MKNIKVSQLRWPGVESLEIEMVERKGVGHPDYIADGIAEAVSKGLCEYYIRNYGVILHHNVDKVLVVGGQAKPVFGGGEILHPIYIIVSGRATYYVRTPDGVDFVPIGKIVLESARRWLKNNFRYLDPDTHVIIDYKIGQGSADLVGVYELGKESIPLANDTSFGIGFAPLSTLEKLVLETERLLNSPQVKSSIPAVGEDVKVMGLRIGKKITLTIAAAIVSRHVRDKDEYLAVKEAIREKVLDLASKIAPQHDVEVHVNTADRVEQGIFYLTVTGTSAEHGDDGATGRGNRANGLITPMRPMSLEATAGKNPVSHVGKIYNVLARIIAEKIHSQLKNANEVYVSLLSQIGRPINDPLVADIKIVADGELTLDQVNEAKRIAEEELDKVKEITRLILEDKVMLF